MDGVWWVIIRTVFGEGDAEVFELFGEALGGCVRYDLVSLRVLILEYYEWNAGV